MDLRGQKILLHFIRSPKAYVTFFMSPFSLEEKWLIYSDQYPISHNKYHFQSNG